MKPLLSLCMIVCNEEKNLPRCLNSIQNVVDEMIIVDTGSQDQTRQIGAQFGAVVIDFEWNENFADARNYGLERATGEWILVLDADEVLEEKSQKAIRPLLQASTADAYECILRDLISLEPWQFIDRKTRGWIRLFRNNPNYRFRSMYHEAVFPSIFEAHGKIENCDLIILHFGPLSEKVQGGQTTRSERSWYYLKRAAELEPENGNLQFYLGLEYYQRGDSDNAYKTLKRAALEIDTKMANLYQTKKGLLTLAQLAFQRQEFDLAYGAAKGSLAVEGYPELNAPAYRLSAEAFLQAIDQAILRSNSLDFLLRIQNLRQCVHLLHEFQAELSQSLANHNAPAVTVQELQGWLESSQKLLQKAESALP